MISLNLNDWTIMGYDSVNRNAEPWTLAQSGVWIFLLFRNWEFKDTSTTPDQPTRHKRALKAGAPPAKYDVIAAPFGCDPLFSTNTVSEPLQRVNSKAHGTDTICQRFTTKHCTSLFPQRAQKTSIRPVEIVWWLDEWPQPSRPELYMVLVC
jgi:hypothetical protein